ncbi:MAG: hypothetical protein JW755_04560 [Candidatus Aminicenantes bacterium]|nr:hypothetical protein [Candidatus Aminicenantes bacterium]
MKKIVGIGLVALALIGGFVLIQNVRSHGPMMGGGGYGSGNYPYGDRYSGPGYGMGPGMMGGGMMGGGMMGPGMMGPSMMGPGYGYGPQYQQPQRPLTEQDAKTIIENYLRATRNPNLKLGNLKEESNFIEAEITTKDGSLVDKILIDKNTGGMRSAY